MGALTNDEVRDLVSEYRRHATALRRCGTTGMYYANAGLEAIAMNRSQRAIRRHLAAMETVQTTLRASGLNRLATLMAQEHQEHQSRGTSSSGLIRARRDIRTELAALAASDTSE